MQVLVYELKSQLNKKDQSDQLLVHIQKLVRIKKQFLEKEPIISRIIRSNLILLLIKEHQVVLPKDPRCKVKLWFLR